jgi:hypothetical protein
VTGLVGSRRFEALLVVAGVALVAVGSAFARSGSALALLPLDLALLVLAGAVIALSARAPEAQRRFAGAAGILLVLVAVPFTRIPSGGEVTVSVTVAFLALGVLGIARTRVRPPRSSLVGIALLVVLGVVTAVSPDRAALLRFAPFVVAVVPLFVLVSGADAATRRRTLRFVVLLAVLEGAFAIVEPLLGAPQLWAAAKINAAGLVKTLPNPLLPDLVRAQGTLGHPLTLGVLLLVAFTLLLRDTTGLRRGARVGAGVVLALGLLTSGSRSSLLLAVLLAIVFLPRWRFGRRGVLVAGAALVVVLVGVVLAAPTLGRWLASGSATHRIGALDALSGLLQQPALQLLLGNGWASSGRLFAEGLLQTDGLKAVDDEFVLLLSQGGLLSLALFVVLLVLAFRTADRTMLPTLIAVTATLLVFDMLAWPSAAALVALVLATSTRPAAGPRTSGRTAPRQVRRAYSR